MAETLELYYMPTCPFCRRVLNFMEVHSIDIPRHDITAESSARSTLEQKGGKLQVPCLFVDGKPLYESDDIITFLSAAFHIDDEDHGSSRHDQTVNEVVNKESTGSTEG